MWELFTRGESPFAYISDAMEMYAHLREGNRLPIPQLCPPLVYNCLMMRCWQWTPDTRPTMAMCDSHDLPGLINELEQSGYGSSMDGHYERPNLHNHSAGDDDDWMRVFLKQSHLVIPCYLSKCPTLLNSPTLFKCPTPLARAASKCPRGIWRGNRVYALFFLFKFIGLAE